MAVPSLRAAAGADPQEFATRRRKLADTVGRGVICLLGNSSSEGRSGFTGFRQASNFYYLTGHSEPGAALLIAPGTRGKPYREVLFLPSPSAAGRKWSKPGPTPKNAGDLAFEEVLPDSKFRSELRTLLGNRGKLHGLVPREREAGSPRDLRFERLRELGGTDDIRTVSDTLAAMRSIKSAGEVALIQAAVDATCVAFRSAWRAVSDGATEQAAAAELVGGAFRAGCERLAFSPIVAGGENATILHYQRNSSPLQAGQVLLIDAGGERSRYAADIARTIPIGGSFSARQRRLYDLVLDAQKAVIEAAKPGAELAGPSAKSLESVAQRVLHAGAPRGVDAHLPHAIGHHVGLDVHDPSPPRRVLREGMVVAIEPGLYLPDEGLGIRIEDMVEITADGCRLMTDALPRSADEIEAALPGDQA